MLGKAERVDRTGATTGAEFSEEIADASVPSGRASTVDCVSIRQRESSRSPLEE
jgi:hypothetical protein